MPIRSVHPFLMFQGEAQAALDFYASVFAEARIDEVEHWRSGEQGPEGAFKRALLTVADQAIICFDSPVKHAFTFTPSFSLFVETGCEDEVRRLADVLGEGGGTLMPAGDYGFSRLFAWVNDRFGVSWQINCG